MKLNKTKIITLSLLFSTTLFSFISCEKDDENNTTQQEESQDANKPDSTNTNVSTDTTGSDITSDTTETATQGDTVSGMVGNYTYVDLGLPSGTKWATYNVGATKIYEYGDYFAWGETTPKEDYSWSTYKWSKGSYNTLTKYCTNSDFGTVDSLTTLLAEDDAATANWGTEWRMPTKAEVDELDSGCVWVRRVNSDYHMYVWVGTSKTNGNIIILPGGGFFNETERINDYIFFGWSSQTEEFNSFHAWNLDILTGVIRERCVGHNVRAVVND